VISLEATRWESELALLVCCHCRAFFEIVACDDWRCGRTERPLARGEREVDGFPIEADC
jgi:hypothetical protein